MPSWLLADGQSGAGKEREVMCGMRGSGCVGMGGRWVRSRASLLARLCSLSEYGTDAEGIVVAQSAPTCSPPPPPLPPKPTPPTQTSSPLPSRRPPPPTRSPQAPHRTA